MIILHRMLGLAMFVSVLFVASLGCKKKTIVPEDDNSTVPIAVSVDVLVGDPILESEKTNISFSVSNLNINMSDIRLEDNKGRILNLNEDGTAVAEKKSIVYAVNKTNEEIIYLGYIQDNEFLKAGAIPIDGRSTAVFLATFGISPISMTLSGLDFQELKVDDQSLFDYLNSAAKQKLEELETLVESTVQQYGSIQLAMDNVTFSGLANELIKEITGGFFGDCTSRFSLFNLNNPQQLPVNVQLNLANQNYNPQNVNEPYFINNDQSNFRLAMNDAQYNSQTGKWLLDISVFSLAPGYYGIHTISSQQAFQPGATFESSVIGGSIDFDYFTKPYNTSSVFQNISTCQGIGNWANEFVSLATSNVDQFSEFTSVTHNVKVEVDENSDVIYFVAPQDHDEVLIMNVLSYIGEGTSTGINALFSAIQETEIGESHESAINLLNDIVQDVLQNPEIAQLIATSNYDVKEIFEAVYSVLIEMAENQYFEQLKNILIIEGFPEVASKIKANPLNTIKLGMKTLSWGLSGWELDNFISNSYSRDIRVHIPPTNLTNWTQTISLPNWSVRWGHVSEVFNNKMWIFGGVTNGARLNDVWYSSDGESWTETTSNAAWSERNSHASVVFDNKIWILGGIETGSILNDVWYSSDGVSWVQTTSNAPWSGRYDFTSVVFDNKIWILGGNGPSDRFDDVWYSSDGVSWVEATSNAPWGKRDAHTSAVFDNKLWVIGGFTEQAGSPMNDVWYSTDGLSWTESISNAPWSDRNHHSTLVFDNKIWVVGGQAFPNYMSDIWYSTNGISWTEETSNAPWGGRSRQSLLNFSNRLWAMGGVGANSIISNEIWFYEN